MAICPNCGRDHGGRSVSHGARHTETYTPRTRAEDGVHATFVSRQAVENGTDRFIGKTTYLQDSDGNIVGEKHGKNGNKDSSAGFIQGLFNWIGK